MRRCCSSLGAFFGELTAAAGRALATVEVSLAMISVMSISVTS
jgi:hypothetical protein